MLPGGGNGVLGDCGEESAQSVTYNFEDLTDQGFGTGFGNDASASFPIVNIGGSNPMEVLDTASFQQAGRETGNPAEVSTSLCLPIGGRIAYHA